MNKVERLQHAATALRSKLREYARSDVDAANVLRLMTPLFEQIEKGEVIPPQEDEFSYYFANTDSPLIEYDDLGELAAEYASVLELWDTKARGLDDM